MSRFQYQVKTEAPRQLDTSKNLGWFQPLSIPEVLKKTVTAALIAPFLFAPVLQPIPPTGWVGSTWSEPVRLKPGLPAKVQQFLAWGVLTPQTVVSFQPWSEPVRTTTKFTPQQQFWAGPVTTVTAVAAPA